MHKLALLLVLVSSPVFADQNFEKAPGATVDCGKDDVVNINHGGGTYTIKGSCKEINLSGGGVKLTIESATAINVNGAGNTLAVGTLGDIVINGAKNKVTYKKAAKGDKPGVTQMGTGNTVTKVK